MFHRRAVACTSVRSTPWPSHRPAPSWHEHTPSSMPHLTLTYNCDGLSRSTRPAATPFSRRCPVEKRITKKTYVEGRAQGTVVAEKQLRPLHCCVRSALGRVRRTVHNGRRVRLGGRLEVQPVILGVEQPLGRPVLAGTLGATHGKRRQGERAAGGGGGATTAGARGGGGGGVGRQPGQTTESAAAASGDGGTALTGGTSAISNVASSALPSSERTWHIDQRM